MGRENLSLAEERVLRPVPWSSPLTPLLPDGGSQPMLFEDSGKPLRPGICQLVGLSFAPV